MSTWFIRSYMNFNISNSRANPIIVEFNQHSDLIKYKIIHNYLNEYLTMDSPVFGSGNHHSTLAPTLKRDFLNSCDINQQNQNLEIIFQIQGNIRKLTTIINSKIIMRNKRAAFYKILTDNKSASSTRKQTMNCIVFTQRKLNCLVALIERQKLRRKIKAWQNIKVFCHNLVLQEEIKASTLQFENKLMRELEGGNISKKKKTSELKQNSTNNIQDTLEENKRLKSEIMNEEAQFDSFAEKMNTLLDAYDLGKINNVSNTVKTRKK